MSKRIVRAAVFTVLTLAGCGGEPPRDGAPAASATSEMRILTTIGDSSSQIEGIAAHQGKLYVADWKDGAIYRVDPANPTPERVGQLPTAPGQAILGLVTDADGNLYAAVPDSGWVLRVAAARLGAADFNPAKDVTRFATGVPGANGLAFDRNGHLWITGGSTGALYHVGPNGGKGVVFAKDFSPMSTDTTMPVRIYTVNGIAFDSAGNAYTANTGTGEIVRLEVKPDYTSGAITSLVKDTRLLGADGIVIDERGMLWVTCNFLSRLARVSPTGEITIVATDSASGANVLRFPAELKRVGNAVYIANLNFPVGRNQGQTERGATIAVVEPRAGGGQ